MKLAILSDLHIEFNIIELGIEPNTDLIVIAGDVSPNLNQAATFLTSIPLPVIYVAGNHDFYGAEYFSRLADMRKVYKNTNVIFLENDEVIVDGVRFLGTTLWSDFLDSGIKSNPMFNSAAIESRRQWHMINAEKGMMDYYQIKIPIGGFIRATDVVNLHNFAISYLERELTKEFDGKTIVVTHNAPTYKTSNPKFLNNSINPAFHNDLEYMFDTLPIDYWIYGHSHYDADMILGNTRIIANHLGYPNEKLRSIKYLEF